VKILLPETDSQGKDLSGLTADIFDFPGNYKQIENENIKKNGDRVWVSWSNQPIIENGVVQEVLAIGNDITERKLSERELQSRALEMEAILACNADGIIVYDKNTRIMRSNAAVEKLLNLQEDERELTLTERFRRRYKAWSEQGRELTAEELPAFRSAVNGETIRNEVIFYHIEGSPRWFKISAAPLIISGEHIGGVVTMADISWRKQMEVKLQTNESILEAFFNSSPGILNLFDQDLRFLKSDKNTPLYFAQTQQSILGKSLSDLNPSLARWIMPIMHEVISTGKSKLNAELEAPVPNKLGGVEFWSLNFFPVPLHNSNKGIGCIGVEITENKQTEKSLARERELFEGIFNNIPVMITIYDPDLNNFRFNKEFKQVTGWTEEDAADGIFIEKVYPDPDYRQEVVEFMKSLKPGWKEWNMTLKDGAEMASSWANIFLQSGVQIGIGIDIRERKNVEAILIRSEQRIRATFDNAAIGIVEVDSYDRFIAVNGRICQMLGYSRKELLGRNVSDITAQEDLDTSEHVNERIHRGDIKMHSYEKRYIKSDGTAIWVNVTVSGVYDSNGKHINSIGTVEDISYRKHTEAQLRETLKIAGEGKTILTALMEYVPLGIIIADAPDAKIRMVSRYGNDLIGKTNEETLGDSATEHPSKWGIFHLDGKTLAKSDEIPLIRTIAHGEYIKNEEWYITAKNGKLVPVICNAAPILNSKGNIIGGVMGFQDNSERRKIMEELRESERRYRLVIDAADLGTWDFDIETGEAAHSLRHDQIFGYLEQQPEWSYETSVRHIFPEYHKTVREAVAKAIETGILSYDAKIRWPDGSIHWIGPRGRVKYDSTGKPVRMMGIVSDITDRKVAEEALRENEEKFRSLFENITEGVALYEIIYENGHPVSYGIIDANPAYNHYTLSENKDSVSPQLDTSKSEYFKEFIQVAETRKPFKFETHFKSENKHFIINVISPKKGQFATVLEDITEQKKIEQELKQKNEELTRFIYTVSHDLKSPLVTIKSFTSFLKEDIAENNTEAQNRDIAFIQNAVDKMGKLLDELLELSRIGRKEIHKTYTPLTSIAQAAIDLVAGRIVQNKIEIRFSGPPVMLYGHNQRLIQLYQNLIDNSAKFIGNQPDPVIEIGSFTQPETQEIVMFVRDNGTGIEPQYHHKLFGLFEKLDNSTEGTGIGLALIKRIVEVHGGTVWLNSEGAGKGATFFFTLEKTHIID
jgi:PAS domain S-box-containing protein